MNKYSRTHADMERKTLHHMCFNNQGSTLAWVSWLTGRKIVKMLAGGKTFETPRFHDVLGREFAFLKNTKTSTTEFRIISHKPMSPAPLVQPQALRHLDVAGRSLQ